MQTENNTLLQKFISMMYPEGVVVKDKCWEEVRERSPHKGKPIWSIDEMKSLAIEFNIKPIGDKRKRKTWIEALISNGLTPENKDEAILGWKDFRMKRAKQGVDVMNSNELQEINKSLTLRMRMIPGFDKGVLENILEKFVRLKQYQSFIYKFHYYYTKQYRVVCNSCGKCKSLNKSSKTLWLAKYTNKQSHSNFVEEYKCINCEPKHPGIQERFKLEWWHSGFISNVLLYQGQRVIFCPNYTYIHYVMKILKENGYTFKVVYNDNLESCTIHNVVRHDGKEIFGGCGWRDGVLYKINGIGIGNGILRILNKEFGNIFKKICQPEEPFWYRNNKWADTEHPSYIIDEFEKMAESL